MKKVLLFGGIGLAGFGFYRYFKYQVDMALNYDYKIKNFKVTAGNCYEIYGWDKAGKKVEIYFNPVTGAKVKENIEK